MSETLKKRIGRLEQSGQASGDWHQFGSDPQALPDWALEMKIREEADQLLNLIEVEQPGLPEAAQARAVLEAGDLDQAVNLILKIDLMIRAEALLF